jgi:hypothetical protein
MRSSERWSKEEMRSECQNRERVSLCAELEERNVWKVGRVGLTSGGYQYNNNNNIENNEYEYEIGQRLINRYRRSHDDRFRSLSLSLSSL